ncbi:glycosyltransferase [Clostridium botulinum]|uniref:glycosyltransferase n=2 Tax=Clostridium botulinum TaxID=1491 RepID=UPI000174EAA5|nr:glycosyltransferase [Clostridium botulinum]ACD51497.1 Eps4F [Clostridium botulinum E3 str. Alaska E43]AJF30992.1 glycosyltransferase [Clostridium botulinum]AJF34054.1 glycosyltransferase [Clostridium botulinum]MBY6790806.1 glycosyltransferase [Clostridium botulinum]MBY6818379.1 glycosyltransferase [Clostridium botulinum]
MKKKIMHIVQSPGGVERYISMFLKNMDLSKYDNILVCSLDYEEQKYVNLVSAFEYVDMTRKINLKSDLYAVIKIRKLIKKYNPDVIYLHSSKAGAIGRIANLGFKNKSIYNPHGWAFNIKCSSVKKKIYLYIEKLMAPLCTYIIAISDFEKECAIENKVCKADKIKVIYNGIDIAEYEEKKKKFTLTRENLGIPKDAYIIGTVGRLTEQKAPDTFIKAAKKIKYKCPKAFFIMVGDGELKDKVKELIKESNLKNSVLITGWVDEPMEYIKLFDQAMLLSRWEGFGLVLAEYMIAGKPIIATDVDAIPNLINNNNGILVKMDSVNEIAVASETIINDLEKCEFMIKNAEEVVRNKFNIKRVIEEFEKICD